MRPLKFRFWSTINDKEMIYPTQGLLSDLIENNDWKVMQYTGLTDKNGKEMYESDKLLDMLGRLYVVMFTGGAFIASNPKEPQDFYFLDDYDFEIIGNIHESPELLENETA